MERQLRDIIGREPCCPEDRGGSHYHCAKCGAVTGMCGHYTSGLRFEGKWLKFDQGVFSCADEYTQALASLGLERVDGRTRRIEE